MVETGIKLKHFDPRAVLFTAFCVCRAWPEPVTSMPALLLWILVSLTYCLSLAGASGKSLLLLFPLWLLCACCCRNGPLSLSSLPADMPSRQHQWPRASLYPGRRPALLTGLLMMSSFHSVLKMALSMWFYTQMLSITQVADEDSSLCWRIPLSFRILAR